MTALLQDVEPQLVWQHFLELTRIPRPSKQEQAARAYVLGWAEARGFGSTVDEAGNVVVQVPASDGRELAPTIVLQSHLDIVCERDPSSPNDPREGRIEVVLENGWVAADGTTLGADDGIGAAAALAAAQDQQVTHGPLQLLFTVSEEQGLEGVKALDPALVTGRLLVNLDGDEEGITVGCAGSVQTFVRRRFEHQVAQEPGLEVRLSGARGGHSGGDIASGRVNANKALGWILASAIERVPFRVARLEGGVSRNAIPREARAVVTLLDHDLDTFRAAALAELEALREDLGAVEPDLVLAVESCDVRSTAGDEATAALVDLLVTIPTGVVAAAPDRPDVVETSTSLNVVQTEGDIVTFASMTRSASAAALDEVAADIRRIASDAGAEMELVRSYPPWEPDLEAHLLGVARRTWRRLFGSDPELTTVHGGLECAILGEKLPGIEMISIGPEIEGPHAPGERVSVVSTQTLYRLLGALLDDLSR
ncbi:MAG: aminoacyl-histidine dipeptidase [Actinobacteria bacterium]|nr:MAG: aminoacyl-histidine dipeptidase [Actinomycetota bacterium]